MNPPRNANDPTSHINRVTVLCKYSVSQQNPSSVSRSLPCSKIFGDGDEADEELCEHMLEVVLGLFGDLDYDDAIC